MASQSRRSMVAAPSAGLLGVTAEGEAHRREYLIGKLRLPARFEARVERRGEHRGRHAGLDRRLERPAPFAGIRHAPPEGGEVLIPRQRFRGEIEEPRGDDAAVALSPASAWASTFRPSA